MNIYFKVFYYLLLNRFVIIFFVNYKKFNFIKINVVKNINIILKVDEFNKNEFYYVMIFVFLF